MIEPYFKLIKYRFCHPEYLIFGVEGPPVGGQVLKYWMSYFFTEREGPDRQLRFLVIHKMTTEISTVHTFDPILRIINRKFAKPVQSF